jgi:hypothetical protein
VFAGTAATGGAAASGVTALMVKLGAGALAGVLAKVVLVLVAAGVSASVIGDWVACKVFMIDECCHQEVLFWKQYGEYVEANGGADKLNPLQCADLTKLLASLKKLQPNTAQALRRFLTEHCEDH